MYVNEDAKWKCGYNSANDTKFAFWNCKYVHNSFSKPKFNFTFK